MAELFGGAIRAPLPAGWLDASDVRPVPDNQEVWTEPSGGADRSLVIELLERADVDDDSCGEFHFTELAHGNEAAQATLRSHAWLPAELIRARRLGETTVGCLVHGVQLLQPDAGGSGDDREGSPAVDLHVRLAVVRLAAHATDMLLSVSRPCVRRDGHRGAHGTGAQKEATAPDDDRESRADAELLSTILSGLTICDWGLFGEGSG